MKAEIKCGILEMGELEIHEGCGEEPAVRLRTREGNEIVIPMPREDIQAIGAEGLLFKNLKMTITLEEDK